jgi:hypothetical protein
METKCSVRQRIKISLYDKCRRYSLITVVDLHVFGFLVFFYLSLDGPELFSRVLRRKRKVWPKSGKM